MFIYLSTRCTKSELFNFNVLFCVDIDESAAGSPSSGELPDPEDFRRKIMEILSDTSDNPEQMKKLFRVVIEAKGMVFQYIL